MRKLICTLLLVSALAGQGLTPAQKEADFRALANVLATYYAPVDWKKQLFQYDVRQLQPWLERVAQTRTDLDFYEVCLEYVNRLEDTHVSFTLPSDFNASLGFFVDIYDGALLIDSINRAQLPAANYPFTFGDELVALDGIDAKQVLESLRKYQSQGNERAQSRLVAQRLTSRAQSRFPNAPSLPDSSTVVIRRQSGALETYTMRWVKTGTPLRAGPVPSPRSARSTAAADDYMKPLRELQFSGVTATDLPQGVLNYGSRNPIYLAALAASAFTRRQGGAAGDFFYSGVFKRDELSIGYLRIPSFSPPSTLAALAELETEINFFRNNTDGLIVDVMRNPGGNLCFGQNVVQRLSPVPFDATGFQTRPFWGRVQSFYNSVISAKAANAPREVIEQYEQAYRELESAAREGRVVTNTLNLCAPSVRRDPWTGPDGTVLAYHKPIMVLTDEFTTSTGDSFASMMQDSGRAVLFGYRTNGAGGNNTGFPAGIYSEAQVGVTIALQTRRAWFNQGYPVSEYTENVGVHPDVVDDYMTKDNLLRGGAPFVADFLEAMAAYIRQRR